MGGKDCKLLSDIKRDTKTLIPLILKHVEPEETIIVTDMWKLDFGLISDGRHHFTVNHFTNFVDPITSANT